jgi:hypothetical protein
MERGRTIFNGDALDGIAQYNALNERGGGPRNAHREVKYPIKEFSVQVPERVGFNESLDFSIMTVSDLDIPLISLSFEFTNHSGAFVAASINDAKTFGIQLSKGQNIWNCRINNIPLKANIYYIVMHLIDKNGVFLATESRVKKIKVEGGHYGLTSDCQLNLVSWKS